MTLEYHRATNVAAGGTDEDDARTTALALLGLDAETEAPSEQSK